MVVVTNVCVRVGRAGRRGVRVCVRALGACVRVESVLMIES